VVEGEWGAQLVGGVGDESPLAVEGVVEAFQHDVEGVGEFLDLVRWAGQRDASTQFPVGRGGVGDPSGGVGNPVQWLQHPSSDQPAEADRGRSHYHECDPALGE
jgi:hypothetical protein